jgi:hypothetical protein
MFLSRRGEVASNMASFLRKLWPFGRNGAAKDGTPVTQIIYLDVDPSLELDDTSSEAGRTWSTILDEIETSPGFQRLYWGRRLELPEKVQLHIGETRSRR